jgi:hypothetical protein
MVTSNLKVVPIISPFGSSHNPIFILSHNRPSIMTNLPVGESFTVRKEGSPLELVVRHEGAVLFSSDVFRYHIPEKDMGREMIVHKLLDGQSKTYCEFELTRHGDQIQVKMLAEPKREIPLRLVTENPPPCDLRMQAKTEINPPKALISADYRELRRVEILMDGDALPGYNAKLGERNIHSNFDRISIAEEKQLFDAILALKKEDYDSIQAWVDAVANKIDEKYNRTNPRSSRYRSALFQLALQQIGINSKYENGSRVGGCHISWVRVDIGNNGSFSYLIDLRSNKRGIVTVRDMEGKPLYINRYKNMLYFPSSDGNVVWRHKSQV